MTAAVVSFPLTAVAIDRTVTVNDSSLSDPIGVGFGHWEGVEPLRISLRAEPGDIQTAKMFAPEAVAWRGTDTAKPDPWVYETAAIMPDEAFAVQFTGTLEVPSKKGQGKGKGGGGGAAPPSPEWAVSVPDVDIDAEGVPDETEFASTSSNPNAPVGLGLVIGQSNPVTITLHPKLAGVLRLTTTKAGVVEVFDAADWPAGQPITLPWHIPVDATRTLSFVVRGRAEGEATLTARFVPDKQGGAGGDTTAVDKLTVRVAPLFVDLDVDSNNNGTIADDDDPIEDDESLPGKVLIVNRLDYTGEGIPGYANGMDHLEHAGDGKSNGFTEMILRIPEVIDREKATLTFSYSDSAPKSTSESPGNEGRHKVHDPGTTKHIRVWTKDGHVSRLAAGISDQRAGHFVTPGKAHKVNAVFNGTPGSEVTLWVEGVNESEDGDARVSVVLDADGSGKPELQADDHVRLTSAWLQLVFTDVTSPNGIGDTAATAVPRIPKDKEADGIACDWQAGVNDGAMLVMRVVGSPILWQFLQDGKLAIKFGHIVNRAFEDLPVSGREGGYLTWPRHHPLVLDQPAALTGLGIEKPGEDYGTGHKVLDARFYRPPDEFDLDTPLNPALERKLNLAVRLNERKSILNYRGSKPHAIALVRAPLVLVHGVNPHPKQWIKEDSNALGTVFHNSYGFRCVEFLVDHRGPDPDPSRRIEGDTLGFGEVSSMFQKVRDKITSSNREDGAATDSFRAGIRPHFKGFDRRPANEAGKRIAVQKVDIIAHSYGGLLSRWYIEKAGEFSSRRDVRKLITLGTPHKGSPLANVVCEVFRGRLIAAADINETILGFRMTLNDLLRDLDRTEFGSTSRLLRGGLPNALDATRSRPRHAYEVFSVGSERLNALNGVGGSDAFHNDVGYAAVVGQNQVLTAGVEPFTAFQAQWRGISRLTARPYWPWLGAFNRGPRATDAIVPVWSAQLGVERFNAFVAVNHIDMDASSPVNDVCRSWLSTPLPRGNHHRAGFRRSPPVSERNAYVGSTIQPDGVSRGAGVRDGAIVKIELGPQQRGRPFEYPGTFGTAPGEVGLRPVALTGMIRIARIGQEHFQMGAIGIEYRSLHNIGIVGEQALNVPAMDMPLNAAADDYVTFRITDPTARLGRRYTPRVIGPDGETGPGPQSHIVYRLAEIPGGESPPARALLPQYQLPQPAKGGAGNLTVSVAGAVEASTVGQPLQQVVDVRLYHSARAPRPGPQGGPGILLQYIGNPPATVGAKVPVLHPNGVFDGLLVPYAGAATLEIRNGTVVGASGDSGVNPASVYQRLETHNAVSQRITVP